MATKKKQETAKTAEKTTGKTAAKKTPAKKPATKTAQKADEKKNVKTAAEKAEETKKTEKTAKSPAKTADASRSAKTKSPAPETKTDSKKDKQNTSSVKSKAVSAAPSDRPIKKRKINYYDRSNMNSYIYRGESEEELKKKLKEIGFINNSNFDMPEFHACGRLYVGSDYRHSWIFQRGAFAGWDIYRMEIKSDEISLCAGD